MPSPKAFSQKSAAEGDTSQGQTLVAIGCGHDAVSQAGK